MVDYSKAKIYKIYNDEDDNIYVGSTCCSLSQRMAKHRYSAKTSNTIRRPLYDKMKEIGVDNFHIVLIADFPECQSVEQLRKKEREYIEQMKSVLNYNIPTRTHKEYVLDNEEFVKEMGKNYRRNNKEKVSEGKEKWNLENPEKVKGYKMKNFELNKEKYTDMIKTWKKKIVECPECGITMTQASLKRHMDRKHS